jgi:hypothetical protein
MIAFGKAQRRAYIYWLAAGAAAALSVPITIRHLC